MISQIECARPNLHSLRRRFASRVTTFGLLLVFALVAVAPVAKCLAAPTDSVDDEFNEDLASQVPELAANQWGWHLTRYKFLYGLYAIRGTLYLSLFSELNGDDGVLWSPLTGKGAHLNGSAFKKISIDYRQNYVPGVLGPLTTLSDGRLIEQQYSPGAGNRCGPLFSYYFSEFDKHKEFIRSFYVIVKTKNPFKLNYNCAGEAGRVDIKNSLSYSYDVFPITYAELMDKTSIILNSVEGDGVTIVRLGQDFQQRTTMGGRIYIMDADPFNADVMAHRSNWDNNYRYDVFLKYVAALKENGVP